MNTFTSWEIFGKLGCTRLSLGLRGDGEVFSGGVFVIDYGDLNRKSIFVDDCGVWQSKSKNKNKKTSRKTVNFCWQIQANWKCSTKARWVCETQMPPIMANSKDGQGHKDKYLDTSKKILSQEMLNLMLMCNMKALIFIN